MSITGKRIHDRRIELGISVDVLAAKLGKNRATVYRYESDDIENMPIQIIKPLAELLHVSPAYLMGWQEQPQQKKEDQRLEPITEKLRRLDDRDLDKADSYVDGLLAQDKYQHKEKEA